MSKQIAAKVKSEILIAKELHHCNHPRVVAEKYNISYWTVIRIWYGRRIARRVEEVVERH